MFARPDSPQARSDLLENEAIAWYVERRPLASYLAMRAAVAEARRLADAHGRLDEVLLRQRVRAVALARLR